MPAARELIRRAVLGVLSDGAWHTCHEFRAAVYEQLPPEVLIRAGAADYVYQDRYNHGRARDRTHNDLDNLAIRAATYEAGRAVRELAAAGRVERDPPGKMTGVEVWRCRLTPARP